MPYNVALKKIKKFLKKPKKTVDKVAVIWYYMQAPLREGS